ncbi:MAG: gliding motility-associated ABC transporter substrate-binding protein GldG [Bacteroidales bacterium]|nr:gliding motility-associated ABC transporter substrate-binding protein GldG [Bacteroidales bacterium]
MNLKERITNKNLLWLLTWLAIIILAVYISSFMNVRVDLTSEKRFTLSPATKSILKNLDDVVYVKIYLDGDMNIPFKKFQRNIRETLNEFKVYAKENIEYEFINPSAETDEKIRDDFFTELYQKGLRPTNIYSKDKEGGTSEKIIFPGAILVYRGIEVAVNLLRNNPGIDAEENINNSMQTIEYELISKIRSLTAKETEYIVFLEGHGELGEDQTRDITIELANYFQVDRGAIMGRPGILDRYKAVIIAKPTQKFNETDKFVLDQYIMKGGKVLWFLDEVNVSLDSLVNGSTFAFINDLGIGDLLFRYGVRINPELVQDVQCNVIPVNMALAGNPPNFVPAPWFYYPLLSAPSTHPITRSLNLIDTKFINPIDTIGARKEIHKTVLLKSSPYARTVKAPAMISLEEIKTNPGQEDFTSSEIPVAVLLEGEFESAFKNRSLSGYFPEKKPVFTEKSVPNKMLIVADGDIIKNEVRNTARGKMIIPLGVDRYTNQTFGNKDFIINAVNYLTDQEGLIQLRSKEFKLRLLDRVKIKEQRFKWQLINTLLPLVIVVLSGILFNYLRKRKYSRINP